jgi:hypothetical protein
MEKYDFSDILPQQTATALVSYPGLAVSNRCDTTIRNLLIRERKS